jgi:hypothetical protein
MVQPFAWRSVAPEPASSAFPVRLCGFVSCAERLGGSVVAPLYISLAVPVFLRSSPDFAVLWWFWTRYRFLNPFSAADQSPLLTSLQPFFP